MSDDSDERETRIGRAGDSDQASYLGAMLEAEAYGCPELKAQHGKSRCEASACGPGRKAEWVVRRTCDWGAPFSALVRP